MQATEAEILEELSKHLPDCEFKVNTKDAEYFNRVQVVVTAKLHGSPNAIECAMHFAALHFNREPHEPCSLKCGRIYLMECKVIDSKETLTINLRAYP